MTTPAQNVALEELKAVKWHSLSVEETLSKLGSRATGLTDEEVAAARAKYGTNFTPGESKPGLLRKIFAQLNNTVVYILVGAAIISAIFKDWADLALIVAVVVLNVLIGVVQEGKAESAAEALQSMMAAKSMVVRNNQQRSITAEEIVVGDILYVQAGDAIGADARVITSANLQTLEAPLTGEATPIEKNTDAVDAAKGVGDRKSCMFAGTSCSTGQGTAVVFGVGAASEIGHIQKMLNSATQTETPLQAALEVFGRVIAVFTILVAIASFLIAWKGRDYPVSEAFALGIGIAVAIIPEGLPSVVTIIMAIGVRKMADHQAIIRQLPAVETLGSVSVVCSDKTGTLTLNQMMVTSVRTRASVFAVDGVGYDPYSGDIHSGETRSIRKANPDLLANLYWLTLPSIIANDGGLVAPSEMATRWPSQRNLNVGGVGAAGVSPGGDHTAVAVGAGDVDAKTSHAEKEESGAKWEPMGDPTDVAALVLGHKCGINVNINSFKSGFPVIAKVPFDSDYKFVAQMQDMTTPAGTKRVVYIKGAWDVLIERCGTQAVNNDPWGAAEPCDQAWWKREASSYAANGMRVLAVAQWVVPDDKTTLTLEELLHGAKARPFLQLNCLLAIVDPCRESAQRAVHECQGAGITVKMITGDHADTACYIAKELGILSRERFEEYMRVKDTDPEARKHIVLQGGEIEAIPRETPGAVLKDGHVPREPELAKYVLDVNVYARVSPEHKLRIVRALKNTHHRITSMTGDGVNDAPALKEAHVGVAMGITGTDVAKQAAKMVLANDEFATIAEAVRRGRGVYDNLTKALLFALPTNFAQGLSIVAAIIIGMQSPLTAMQVLTVNMVTSVTLGIVIALEEPEPDVMNRPPRDPKSPLLNGFVLWRTFYVTLLLVVAMLGIMQWELEVSGSVPMGRACAMSVLVLAQGWYALSCRYVNATALTPRVFVGNPWLLAAIFVNAAIQCFLVYTPGVNEVWGMAPIDGLRWLRIIGLSLAVFLVIELEKWAGPKVWPYLRPCFAPLGACFSACGAGIKKCCVGYCCNLFCPSSSPMTTGLPTPADKSGVAGLRNALTFKSTEQVADEAAAAEAKESEYVARIVTHGHRHVVPAKPEVASIVSKSKRRLEVYTPSASTRHLAIGSSSAAGAGAGAGAGFPGAAAVAAPSAPHVSHGAPPMTAEVLETSPQNTTVSADSVHVTMPGAGADAATASAVTMDVAPSPAAKASDSSRLL